MFFYSKTMEKLQERKHQNVSSAGYYLLALKPRNGITLLHSNNERAFIISQLQDILTRRSLLEIPRAHQTLAAHIDLLAFSIARSDVQLVLFSLSYKSVLLLGKILATRLAEYQVEWRATPYLQRGVIDPGVSLRRLVGPHHALNQSVQLHLRHQDWEYDRYSSIGFYLHDRRGEWMHLWRLSRLYDNDSQLYRLLLEPSIAPRLVPLSHV
jgi:hypothetical protein